MAEKVRERSRGYSPAFARRQRNAKLRKQEARDAYADAHGVWLV